MTQKSHYKAFTLRNIFRKNENTNLKRYMQPNVYSTLFTIAKIWKPFVSIFLLLLLLSRFSRVQLSATP